MDNLFLLLVFICASGLIATGGFFLMLGFVWLTEGKEEARRIFWLEWNGRVYETPND